MKRKLPSSRNPIARANRLVNKPKQVAPKKGKGSVYKRNKRLDGGDDE